MYLGFGFDVFANQVWAYTWPFVNKGMLIQLWVTTMCITTNVASDKMANPMANTKEIT